jgi:DNA-binding MarR family transcriptional regulator
VNTHDYHNHHHDHDYHHQPSRDLIHLLSRAEHLAVRRLAAALEAEQCSIEQWRALAFLADGQGRTMTDLADYALLPAPSATKLIDRMVADALAYRRPDPADRRRVLVYLTERGTLLHGRTRDIVQREQNHLQAVLDGTRERELADQLARLADALDPAPRRMPAASPTLTAPSPVHPA